MEVSHPAPPHGTRADGAGGSAGPACAHEAGARPGEETARKGVRGRELSASQLRPVSIIGIFINTYRLNYRRGSFHATTRMR